MAIVDRHPFRATSRFAPSMSEKATIKPPHSPTQCSPPGCGRVVSVNHDGRFAGHVNSFGFHCDGIGMTPAQTAKIKIDAAGRLIGIDEMKRQSDAEDQF